MIKIHLSRLLGERKMHQSDLAKLTGIRPATINDYYHEVIVRMTVEHLDLICEALGCTTSDLIEYIPNKVPKTGSNLIIEEHGNRKDKK